MISDIRDTNFAKNTQPVTLVRLSDHKAPSLWGRLEARLRNSKTTILILQKPKLANNPMSRKSPEKGTLKSETSSDKGESPVHQIQKFQRQNLSPQ